jgi:hypothetical protein
VSALFSIDCSFAAETLGIEDTNNYGVLWQIYGVYQVVDEHHPSIFAYERTDGREIYLTALNFSNEWVEWEMPPTQSGEWSVVISLCSSVQSGQVLETKLQLGPFEGVVCRRQSSQTVNGDSGSEIP